MLFFQLFPLILSGTAFLIWYLVATPVITFSKNKKAPKAAADRLYKHVEVLTTMPLPRHYQNLKSLNRIAEYLSEEFSSYGYFPEEQLYKVGYDTYKNIVASYGSGDLKETIVVGAHYDVCGDQPGADDNASAVAGLLEIARMLQEYKPVLPYRIELVAYTLEEPPFFRTPLMGSAVHAKRAVESGMKIKLMICLEMIGYFSDQEGSQTFPVSFLKYMYPAKGNFILLVGKLGENFKMKKFKGRMKRSSDIDVRSINAPASIPGVDFSDHQNYWKHNIPAIMITDSSFYRNPNYHAETDSIETLDFRRMTEVVSGTYFALLNI